MIQAEKRQVYSKYSSSCYICGGKNWQDCKCLEGDNALWFGKETKYKIAFNNAEIEIDEVFDTYNSAFGYAVEHCPAGQWVIEKVT